MALINPKDILFKVQMLQGAKGDRGDAGATISKVEITGTTGNNVNYKITLTDGTTTTFSVPLGDSVGAWLEANPDKITEAVNSWLSEHNITNTTYTLTEADGNIKLTGSDGTINSVAIPRDIKEVGRYKSWDYKLYNDNWIEATKTFNFSSLSNYTAFGSLGGYSVSNVIFPYKMTNTDYSIYCDVKIGNSFSWYSGAEKSAEYCNLLLTASTSGAQAVTITVTICGFTTGDRVTID